MGAAVATVEIHRPLPPEEAARGDFYALLARLAFAPPDAPLLAALAQAAPLPADADRALAAAWKSLGQASSVMDADAAGEEYDALFVAVGKAPVSIYAGHYVGAMAVDHPRVRLPVELAGLGLAHRDTATEPADHFAALFEVMRVLASGGAGRGPASVGEQKEFFDAYLAEGARKFFEAIGACPQANYYRHVAALGLAFIALESASFELD